MLFENKLLQAGYIVTALLAATVLLTVTGLLTYNLFFWFVLGADYDISIFFPHVLVAGIGLSLIGPSIEVLMRLLAKRSLYNYPGRMVFAVFAAYLIYRTLLFLGNESDYLQALNVAFGFEGRHVISFLASVIAAFLVIMQNTILGMYIIKFAVRCRIIPSLW